MFDFTSMSVDELEARSNEIHAIEEASLTEEIGEEYRSIMAELENRRAVAQAEAEVREEVNSGAGEVVENFENNLEERKMFGIETKEYRDAFYAMIAGTATPEQRAIVVDTTGTPGGGDAIAIPKTLDEKIWDGIHTAHPILADVATVRSGIAMEVTKHTAIATRTSKKTDNADTPAEESNTFVKVVLYGYDYEKYVELTYAESKMSQGALEDYLAEEIAAEIGEALAKDVFVQILSDAGAGQAVTPASPADMFADVKGALALATLANNPVIYAPAAQYYEIVGAIASGSTFNIAKTLGCEVKLDNAAAKVTVVDPKSFILNIVQDTLIESDRNVKDHKVVVSGYLRAQGTLRKNKAAAYIA